MSDDTKPTSAILSIPDLIVFGKPNANGRVYPKRCVRDAIKTFFKKRDAIPVFAGEPTGNAEIDADKIIGFIPPAQIDADGDKLAIDVTFPNKEVAEGVRDLILSGNATFSMVAAGTVKENTVKHLKLQCFSVRATEEALKKIEDAGLKSPDAKDQ